MGFYGRGHQSSWEMAVSPSPIEDGGRHTMIDYVNTPKLKSLQFCFPFSLNKKTMLIGNVEVNHETDFCQFSDKSKHFSRTSVYFRVVLDNDMWSQETLKTTDVISSFNERTKLSKTGNRG